MDDIFKIQCWSLPKLLFAKKYRKIEPSAKLFYAVIFSQFLKNLSDEQRAERFRDREGCFISADFETFKNLFFCSRSSIYDWIRTLEKAGLIEARPAERIDGRLIKKIYFNL